MALSLISVNIERDTHLPLVEAFLREQQADVVCLQEAFEADLAGLAAAAGGEAFFVPRIRYPSPRGLMPEGLAIISRLPLLERRSAQFAGIAGELPVAVIGGSVAQKQGQQQYRVASCLLEKEGAAYRIATTHFPWTPDGEADGFQRAALPRLLRALEPLGEFVLCGDFNAPRGKEIFSRIAARYRDNVPPEYETSIDGTLHRAGPMALMVDGLFSTPGYRVTEAAMHCGVSDHRAITARIERVA